MYNKKHRELSRKKSFLYAKFKHAKERIYMSIITKGNENKKVVDPLNEIKRRKIVEHNDLITSIAKMDKVPLKIFELAVSYINTDNPPKDHIIYLSKTELFKFFDVSDNDKHSRFKKAVDKMQEQNREITRLAAAELSKSLPQTIDKHTKLTKVEAQDAVLVYT